jgi:glutamate-ammonia-ligase adenylyltransferase
MIYGSQELVAEFNEVIDQYRYPTELSSKSIIEIRRIKARIETERLPQGADPKRHLKLGRGSLSDIEWLVQLLQLKHGNEFPGIRTPKTLDALKALVESGLMEEHDARVLAEAWTLTSRVRSSGVLWSNKVSDVLSLDRRFLNTREVQPVLWKRITSLTPEDLDKYLKDSSTTRQRKKRAI